MIRHTIAPCQPEKATIDGRTVGLLRIGVKELMDWNAHEGMASSTNAANFRKHLGNSRMRARIDNDPGWYGIGSFKQHLDALEDGHVPSSQRVQDLTVTMRQAMPGDIMELPNQRRRARWSDAGEELDRERLYNGDLDRAWRTVEREAAPAPVVSVVFEWGANANHGADNLFWSGALATVLTDHLIESGHNVELHGLDYIEHDNRIFTATLTTMKEAHEPLRVLSLATATALPSVYRSNVFRMRQAHIVKTRRGGMVGGTVHPNQQVRTELLQRFGLDPATTIHLANAYSMEDAQRAARSAMAELRSKVKA